MSGSDAGPSKAGEVSATPGAQLRSRLQQRGAGAGARGCAHSTAALAPRRRKGSVKVQKPPSRAPFCGAGRPGHGADVREQRHGLGGHSSRHQAGLEGQPCSKGATSHHRSGGDPLAGQRDAPFGKIFFSNCKFVLVWRNNLDGPLRRPASSSQGSPGSVWPRGLYPPCGRGRGARAVGSAPRLRTEPDASRRAPAPTPRFPRLQQAEGDTGKAEAPRAASGPGGQPDRLHWIHQR